MGLRRRAILSSSIAHGMNWRLSLNLGWRALALLALSVPATAQIEFRAVDREIIQSRLEDFSKNNGEREIILKRLFGQSGCKPDQMSEQAVKRKLPPNLICILPGQSDKIILVGAHSDHADFGDGVVDNWSGASLLPSLLYSVSDEPRRHTFVFVTFSGEEEGMLGSDFYAKQLNLKQRSSIEAMINLDTLGLGPTEVWVTHSDDDLVNSIGTVAAAMKLPVSAMNVDQVGTTDSESFSKYKIPRITIHSVTQETWTILHTNKDNLSAIKMDDYYASYRLLAGYLAYLDGHLGSIELKTQPSPK